MSQDHNIKKNTTFLPMTQDEMSHLGWDTCDIIIVTGDAYIDHPSFGMALIGRLLESEGFRVGILSQPNWKDKSDFLKLGKPNLFYGITSGNMDSMVNHYTSDKKRRNDDAYTPDGLAGMRPDRALLVYAQRAREAYKDVPIILGGIEASLRRLAHFDYWSEKVRRSILPDSKADILLFGNAEHAIVEIAHRLAKGESINKIRNIRGTAYMTKDIPEDYSIIDASSIEDSGAIERYVNPYQESVVCEKNINNHHQNVKEINFPAENVKLIRNKSVIRLPSYEQVTSDKILYAHTSRIFHLETNPHNARSLVQKHGDRYVWLNPPPIPLTQQEIDHIYELPYTRSPHPIYQNKKIPAWEMIRFSITIMRGCFGGCTFCSITEHEGRIIQSRSQDSILREIETIRDTMPNFTGVISDLGGPTANMYELKCKDTRTEALCRRLSCVYPEICHNLITNHKPLIQLYQQARALPGIKKVHIASGVRYDLAIRSPEYVKELVTHHVGGYLKIAPEHTEEIPLSKMMKPSIDTYQRFHNLFDQYSKQANKKQYLIPYFISGHPGTTDEDMLNLALWLKKRNYRLDQVQSFLPAPMTIATAMYHTGKNPLKGVNVHSEKVFSIKGLTNSRLHKAFLRYHDKKNWPILREALKKMGREDLIGNDNYHLIGY